MVLTGVKCTCVSIFVITIALYTVGIRLFAFSLFMTGYYESSALYGSRSFYCYV